MEKEDAKYDKVDEQEKINEACTTIDDREDFELKIEAKVSNEEEAYKLYCNYAVQKGFEVRKGNIRRDKSGVIRQRDYLCAKSGYYLDADPIEIKKTNKLVKRTGCKAFVRFTVKEDFWEISHFNGEHNHELVALEDRRYLKINRKIDSANASVISSMVDAGIRGVKTYSYLVKEVGGAENVGFTQKDCQNFISKRKMNLIERGDAQSVITHFKHRLGEDPLDYDCFGDVVVFDATYRTNRYNMIFAPFVGINHHWKNILFGCAFLLDETTDSFVWLFETFLEAMGNKAPKTIFTDQCQAMANAIKKVFPNTCHRLCSWHISKNATQRLGSLYANNQFKILFNRCLYNCETESEFEATWGEMITIFDLANNKWLKGLYEIREKWCPAFTLHVFSGGMKSTQRSESMNNVLHKFTSKTMNLTEFVNHYEEQCEKMRLAEKDEDYRCKHGRPQIQVRGSKLLMHAADVYTVTIYNLFSDEFISSLTVHLEEVSKVGTLYNYRLFEEGNNRHHNVEFNSFDYNVLCSCKLFESVGWLCRHTLKVLNMWRVTKIPVPYILNRWTKSAKKELLVHGYDKSNTLRKPSLTIERNNMMQIVHHAINHLMLTDEGRKVVRRKVAEMWEEAKRIENMDSSKSINENLTGNTREMNCGDEELVVLIPPTVREKGVTNARKKSYLEKKKRKQKGGKKRFEATQVVTGNNITFSTHNESTNGESHSYCHAANPTSIQPFSTSQHLEDSISSCPIAHPNFSFSKLLQNDIEAMHLTQDYLSNVITNINGEKTP